VMSSLMFLVVNQTIGETSRAFLEWGWRVPFLFSAVLIVIAMYVRLNVAETPVFAELRERVNRRTPLADLFARQRRAVLLASGAMIGFFALGFMGNTFLMSYAHTHVGFSPTIVLMVSLLGGVVALVCNTVSAVLCDTFGRRRVIMAAFTVGVPWSFVVLPLLNTGNTLWFAVAIAGTFAIAGCAYGPMAAFIPEIFATSYRYSGAGLSLNLAGLVGGAVPTIAAAPLLANYGVASVGVMLAAVVAVSLACTALLPETKGVALQRLS